MKKSKTPAPKSNKKSFYNPTEDYNMPVNFEPSRLMKNKSPNDSKTIDGNAAIRKFK